MRFCTCTTFDADFPDDAVWDDKGNLVIPPGRGITDYLSERISGQGIPCSKPAQHSFYGWAFDAVMDGVGIWCLIQGVDHWVLLTEIRRALLDRLLRRKHEQELSAFLDAINQILNKDPRFSSIARYTPQDYASIRKPVRRDKPT